METLTTLKFLDRMYGFCHYGLYMFWKTLVALFWFPASLGIIIINIFLVSNISKMSKQQVAEEYILSPLADGGALSLSVSEHTSQVLGASIVAADARGKLLYEFLNKYDSPMAPYAYRIVEESDKNSIDFRLVVSIAMCESNLGKRIPPNSFNAWGIAVYTGQQTGANFNDWDHAIVWVSKYIKERYIDRGFTTLREIGAIYAPPSVNTGHSWSKCVETFQDSIL